MAFITNFPVYLVRRFTSTTLFFPAIQPCAKIEPVGFSLLLCKMGTAVLSSKECYDYAKGLAHNMQTFPFNISYYQRIWTLLPYSNDLDLGYIQFQGL